MFVTILTILGNKTQMEKKFISVISPLYNEEGNVMDFWERLIKVCKTLNSRYNFEFIFVDDGSKDKTVEKLEILCSQNENVKVISFSRNFGHQIALTAGYDFASGDAVICIDGDLQQPPEIIPEMILKWENGNELVYTIRKETKSISLFKKFATSLFYWFISRISNIPIDKNVADFRLMSRKMLDEFLKLRERDRFIRGMVNWLGFKRDSIEYIAEERKHGKSKYSFFKLISFALNAITSFSGAPLRSAFILGFIIAILSFCYGFYMMLKAIVFDASFPPGWLSVLVSILFLGGIQLIFIGVLGEYIYKMFDESKKRPLYVINKRINL